ncbi:MAG: DNA mismatch repair protein MutS [archaeon]
MSLTPAMQQYVQVKEQNPDCIVLFRMGDFYETFYEDAKTASRVLGIALTARGKGEKKAPLAGIPYHALDIYLAKLIRKGHKVCIVEQLEDPKQAKGLVKRGVTRIITPGTVVEESLLSAQNNYIVSLSMEGNMFGLAAADVSTGEFIATQTDDYGKILGEIEKLNPAEITVPMSLMESVIVTDLKKRQFFISELDDRHYWPDKAEKTLQEHFNVLSTGGYGLEGRKYAASASGALLTYLKQTQKIGLDHMNSMHSYFIEDYMLLDSATQKNLELVRNIRDGSSRGTLFEVLNKTSTSMGARKMKQWLTRPLLKPEEISYRLAAVTELKDNALVRAEITELLNRVADLHRIISRIVFSSSNARDLVSLKNALVLIPEIQELLNSAKSGFLSNIRGMKDHSDVRVLIEAAIRDDCATGLKEGNLIRAGYNPDLDQLKSIASGGKEWISRLEEEERDRTGIKNLRIRYNRVFGYFIEVTKSNLNRVPPDYIRKQTQANCERFITEGLKKKEETILGAQERINTMEYEIFLGIAGRASEKKHEILDTADKIASLDCLSSLSRIASENSYSCPEISGKKGIDIRAGRHPVVELQQPGFIHNDCITDDHVMKIITGPNMSGKSTYLRQVALIVLMAQMGSYVPAESARIGIVDRIFSRVGAYDDLTMGQSTFMVEMIETANILNNATDKSLIILDEIGRGTSTYDGFSLAWAIVEYIHETIKAQTLFATHYHQLNLLTEKFPSIRNYHVDIKESENDIIFLRKVKEGGTDRSYGVHVAKLAGLPKAVISSARRLMGILEKEDKLMPQLEKLISDKSRVQPEKNKTGQMTLLDL